MFFPTKTHVSLERVITAKRGEQILKVHYSSFMIMYVLLSKVTKPVIIFLSNLGIRWQLSMERTEI